MAGNPQVLGLLEEMLDSGKTPEEVCCDCPELLPEVRQRWQEFRRIDAQVVALLPGLQTPDAGAGAAPPTASLPLVPGYEVEAVRGRGGMGVVYKARHLDLKRTVALKMLAAGHGDPAERARFRAEAEAVARLQHPNIVQIYEIGEAAGLPFIALEFVAGGSLAERLAGQPLPPHDAARLVAALAEAMHLAHSRNLIHRDLKPGNVLLAGAADTPVGQCQPKVTDFGLVRQLDADSGQTFDGVVMGTPSYMAPEQAEGRAHAAGPAADVYALGAILYECLTGRPPFQGATPLETLLQVRTCEPVAPSVRNRQVPRDLETICLKCLRKEPERRYSSARELADDLRRFVRGEPVAARPVGVAERVRKWVRRRPAAAGLVAAVVLLVSAVGFGTLVLYQQRLTAHARQAQADQEVRRVIEQAQVKLKAGWLEHDLTKLTEGRTEADQAEGIARSGGASPEVQKEAEAFREEAVGRLERAKKNRTLMEAVLDVWVPRAGRLLAQPTLDEQYVAAFRQWGLDVDGTAEAEVVARFRQEPDVVVQELIAGLDGWMIARRQNRPKVEWRRLFRIADQLDRSDRHGRLRALLVGKTPLRAEWVAGLVGVRSPWQALWEQARGNIWRYLRDVRQDIDPTEEPALTVILLARACTAVGDTVSAEEVLRQAATAQPGQVVLLNDLAKLLERQGSSRLEEAIGYYRAARALRRHLGIALSMALCRAGRAKQGEGVLQELIRQQPDNFRYRFELGFPLAEQHKFAEAEATLRKAIELEPDYAAAYNILGNTLYEQQKHAEAEAAYRKAIALKPDLAGAYNNLGVVLNVRRRHKEAEAAARKAVGIDPGGWMAYNTLGVALNNQGKYAAAEAALRKAVALQPEHANAYTNLGPALIEQQKYAEAEAALWKAVALRPKDAVAYTNLGRSLVGQQKHVQAEAAFHKAMALQPHSGEPRFFLGFELMQQARFHEAAAVLKEAGTLLPAKHPDGEQVRQLLEQCQRYSILDARLPAILRGTDKAVNAAEQLEFGDLCIRKRFFAAAAHCYADAFTADPKLAEDMPAGTRYNAACAAALAGCAQGEDAGRLDDKERTRSRRQALDWIRQDLTWWAKKVENGTAQASASTKLRNWQSDPDLAGVRERDGLARLPDEERAQWERLWAEVDALVRRVSQPE